MIDKMTNTESISLHVRRWDYLWSGFGWICEKSYYQKAIDYIKHKTKKPVFFIFSEDIDRCKQNLDIENNSHFIDWNTKENSYKDLILMSKCNHNIIANSSFSRRGARLNPNPEKIIVAPIKWHQNLDYNDIIPEEWTRIW